MAASPLLALADIAPGYDALFCDIWGVVHDGRTPHASAIAALKAFRAGGGQVVLVSNSPRTNTAIMRQLAQIGVPEICDAVMSSGQVTREHIKPFAGQTVHHVGRYENTGLFEGLDLSFGPPEAAACVIVSELENVFDTPDDYTERLVAWQALDLPFICVNPDKLVEEAGQMIYCPGAIADLYQELGGQVVQAGKPYAPIYEAAYEALAPLPSGPIDKSRILAIGDSLRTDAMGAAQNGLDFLFITGSLHADELDAFGTPEPEKIAALLAPSGVKLIGYQSRLA